MSVSIPPRPAVFLDRDGTLMEEVNYCREPALVRLFPDVQEGLRRLHAAGFRNVIVTNQSGIGRGRISEEEFKAVQARLLELIGGEWIDAVYFCPDLPDQPSTRRKPLPGMILEAARELNLDLKGSWMIGDKAADVQCGVAAGVRSILVRTGYGHSENPDKAAFVADSFRSAVDFILGSSTVANPIRH